MLKKTEKHHTFPFDRRFLPLRASVLPWWLLCAGSGRWRWVCSVASLAFLGHSRTDINVGPNQIKCKEPDMPKGMICEDIGFKFHRIPMCMYMEHFSYVRFKTFNSVENKKLNISSELKVLG